VVVSFPAGQAKATEASLQIAVDCVADADEAPMNAMAATAAMAARPSILRYFTFSPFGGEIPLGLIAVVPRRGSASLQLLPARG
jgi:hypothetical protein